MYSINSLAPRKNRENTCSSEMYLFYNSAFTSTLKHDYLCTQSSCLVEMVIQIYEGKSLNNRNFILKCMEKHAQWKILFQDTKWLLSIMPYRGHDDRAVWACAIASTTWLLHCQIAPWKSNEALFVFCCQRVWNLLKSTEEWRFSMETVVWVRGECMNGWKDFKTSAMNTGVGDQLACNWDSETADRAANLWLQSSHYWWNCCRIQHESWLCIRYCPRRPRV